MGENEDYILLWFVSWMKRDRWEDQDDVRRTILEGIFKKYVFV